MSLLAIAATTALVGSGVQAYSSYQQGKSAEAAGKVNAALAQREADQQRQAGQLEAERMRRERIRLAATQRAGFAKSGVTSEGTPLQVMIQSAADEELNAQMTQYNAGIGAMRSGSEASIYKAQGVAAKRAGTLQAGSSLLSGVSQAAYIRAAGASPKPKKIKTNTIAGRYDLRPGSSMA